MAELRHAAPIDAWAQRDAWKDKRQAHASLAALYINVALAYTTVGGTITLDVTRHQRQLQRLTALRIKSRMAPRR